MRDSLLLSAVVVSVTTANVGVTKMCYNSELVVKTKRAAGSW